MTGTSTAKTSSAGVAAASAAIPQSGWRGSTGTAAAMSWRPSHVRDRSSTSDAAGEHGRDNGGAGRRTEVQPGQLPVGAGIGAAGRSSGRTARTRQRRCKPARLKMNVKSGRAGTAAVADRLRPSDLLDLGPAENAGRQEDQHHDQDRERRDVLVFDSRSRPTRTSRSVRSASPPSIAPGSEPMPPSTAAVNALMPATKPM